MSQTSPQLALPFIQPAQAQKHVTHNEAIEILDAIVQLTLQAVESDAPPASPAEGEAWGVGEAPTGAWEGRTGQIATWRGGGWLYLVPRTGWRAWVLADDEVAVWTGSAWVPLQAEAQVDFDDLDGVGINASADPVNRLAVSAEATLLNHDGAGHQLKINKAGATETGSLLYQTGFSGRAEMGCAGTDDFAVKVSADGATWFTALRVTGIDGAVSLPQMLTLPPRGAPAGASAGTVYFDAGSAKLRCFDGIVWQDLY